MNGVHIPPPPPEAAEAVRRVNHKHFSHPWKRKKCAECGDWRMMPSNKQLCGECRGEPKPKHRVGPQRIRAFDRYSCVNLKKIRDERGISRLSLATAADTYQEAIYVAEKRGWCRYELAQKLAKALGVDALDLAVDFTLGSEEA